MNDSSYFELFFVFGPKTDCAYPVSIANMLLIASYFLCCVVFNAWQTIAVQQFISGMIMAFKYEHTNIPAQYKHFCATDERMSHLWYTYSNFSCVTFSLYARVFIVQSKTHYNNNRTPQLIILFILFKIKFIIFMSRKIYELNNSASKTITKSQVKAGSSWHNFIFFG